MHSDLKKGVDVYDIISRVFDGNIINNILICITFIYYLLLTRYFNLGSKLLEFKKNYGPTLITGFAKLYG